MIIGVDLGGTNIRAGIQSGENLVNPKRDRFNTLQTKQETLSQLIEFVRPLIRSEVNGIGIGVPSVVDVEKGIVFNVANIPSWDRVPLKDILEDEFRIRVVVNNDVNCFALGEHRFGLVKGMSNVVGITSGTGLGSGIIINNQLFNGSNCGAGEIGLLPYLAHNLEYYASGNFFRAFHNISGEEAHEQALAGDAAAIGYWNEFGVHMAQAVKSAVLAYDPQAIVLGGSLSNAFNLFANAMHEALLDFPYPQSIKKLKIFQSQNPNITLLGAAALLQLDTPGEVKA